MTSTLPSPSCPLRAVDLFAGAGGFSTGAMLAGAHVVWAANHWPLAVHYHQANHPGTLHACQDLRQADWTAVPEHDILLASPCCQGHSRARGKDRPHHDSARATAWAVVDALDCHRTPFALVENVKEFREWELYPAWENALHLLGYSVAPHLVNAADFGVPQERVRLFLVLTRSKAPLHLSFPRTPHVPVDSIIQWQEGDWTPLEKQGRSPLTIAQAKNALRQDGCGRGIFAYYSSDRKAGRPRSIRRPMGTVTTKGRFGLVREDLARGPVMRMTSVSEYVSAMGFPTNYLLPDAADKAINLLGNAVAPPVAARFIRGIIAHG